MLRDPSLIPLSHQHHNGLALAVLTERALRAGGAPEEIERLAQRIVDRFEIEIKNHFELEEELLFPPLRALPLVEVLLGEHRHLESLVDRLRDKPEQNLILEFTSLLRRHIRVEESDLFEQAQQLLSRETLDEIGRQLDARAVRVCL